MTEREANLQLEKFGDFLIKIKGINYVAVVEDENLQITSKHRKPDFAIEIGVDKEHIKDIDNYLFKSSKKHILDQNPVLKSLQRAFYDDGKKGIVITKELKVVPSKEFSFQCKKIKSGKGITNNKMHMKSGTLGGIVTLKGDKNGFYILSNWHVLMGNHGELRDPIIRNAKQFPKKQKIGELFWGVYNDFYDLALAKITCKNWSNKDTSIKPISSLEEIELGANVKKFGNATQNKTNTLYSKNAFVKIKGGKIFKNQILTKFLSKKGDSGSWLLDNNNKLIGVIFAGDNKRISVANNIIHIMNADNIPVSNYSHDFKDNGKIINHSFKMPKIEFNKFYTKTNF